MEFKQQKLNNEFCNSDAVKLLLRDNGFRLRTPASPRRAIAASDHTGIWICVSENFEAFIGCEETLQRRRNDVLRRTVTGVLLHKL